MNLSIYCWTELIVKHKNRIRTSLDLFEMYAHIKTSFVSKMDGYTFEEWNFNFDLLPIVDATYILYLEGSSRIHMIKQQIFRMAPTKKVYLVRNEGHRKVRKPLIEQTSKADCAYSHYMTVKHALKNSYERVLILEDDFIFEKEMYDPTNLQSISNFLLDNDLRSYFLGMVPYCLLPASLDLSHWKILAGGASQGVIHSSRGMRSLVADFEKDQNITLQIDTYLAARDAYTFHIPLCTQKFDLTENRETKWGNKEKFFDRVSFLGCRNSGNGQRI